MRASSSRRAGSHVVFHALARSSLWVAMSCAACVPEKGTHGPNEASPRVEASSSAEVRDSGTPPDGPDDSVRQGAAEGGDILDNSASAGAPVPGPAHGPWAQFSSDEVPAACSPSPAPLGPDTHDRQSIARFLCGAREKCGIYKYTGLPSDPGSVNAVVGLWIGDKFDPKSDELYQDVLSEYWLVRAGAQKSLTRRLLARSLGFKGSQRDPGAPAGTLTVDGNLARYGGEANSNADRGASHRGCAHREDADRPS